MSACGCNTCPPSDEICVPSGDAAVIWFEVKDEDGSLFDISGALDIVFLVATENQGTVLLTKKMSLGGVTIDGTGSAFYISVTRADTELLTSRKNYYEATVIASSGSPVTVSAGIFSAPPTMNKDLV
jgi:hypothetical protein